MSWGTHHANARRVVPCSPTARRTLGAESILRCVGGSGWSVVCRRLRRGPGIHMAGPAGHAAPCPLGGPCVGAADQLEYRLFYRAGNGAAARSAGPGGTAESVRAQTTKLVVHGNFEPGFLGNIGLLARCNAFFYFGAWRGMGVADPGTRCRGRADRCVGYRSSRRYTCLGECWIPVARRPDGLPRGSFALYRRMAVLLADAIGGRHEYPGLVHPRHGVSPDNGKNPDCRTSGPWRKLSPSSRRSG